MEEEPQFWSKNNGKERNEMVMTSDEDGGRKPQGQEYKYIIEHWTTFEGADLWKVNKIQEPQQPKVTMEVMSA